MVRPLRVPMNDHRATIIDLARLAGVSKMTVSRALRGERGISAATRIRIQSLATELGYRPDPAVSELMGRLRKSRHTGLEPLAWLTHYPAPVRHRCRHRLGSGVYCQNPVITTGAGNHFNPHAENIRLPDYTRSRLSILYALRG